MAKPKLVSLNGGITLVVLRDGKEEKTRYSFRLPSGQSDLQDVLSNICDYLNEEFGTEFVSYDSASSPIKIQFAKPKIKAPAPKISQEEFNKRIKELVP